MKKTALIALSSFLFLLIASLVAYMLRYTEGAAYVYLIIGVIALIASAVLAYIFHEHFIMNIACFAISAVSLGFLIRAWYIFRGFDNDIKTMLLVCAACTAYLWLFCFLSYIPFIKRNLTAAAVIYALISLVLYVVVVFTTKTTYVSTFGYYMIVEIAFVYALISEAQSMEELMRAITLCTFSVFGVAIIVAVFIFAGDGADCDCDAGCDCCDPCDCGSGRKKKNKK